MTTGEPGITEEVSLTKNNPRVLLMLASFFLDFVTVSTMQGPARYNVALPLEQKNHQSESVNATCRSGMTMKASPMSNRPKY